MIPKRAGDDDHGGGNDQMALISFLYLRYIIPFASTRKHTRELSSRVLASLHTRRLIDKFRSKPKGRASVVCVTLVTLMHSLTHAESLLNLMTQCVCVCVLVLLLINTDTLSCVGVRACNV